MTLNEFSSTTASIFGNFEKIIRMLKSISDPKYITVANRRSKLLGNMSEHISIINKFHPFAHAEFFTKEEKENIFSLLKLTDNYISSMISDIFSDDIYRNIITINDDLIRYSRISKFIQGTHNQPNTLAMFKNQASNEIAKVVDLKNEIEISATQIRELAVRNANSHDKIIKLVTDLNAETKKFESAGSEIEFILKKSRDALIGIESYSKKLKNVEEKLKNIVNTNKSMQDEIIKKSAESDSEIKNLLDKKNEIKELKTIIS
ncbi:hypothetical protein NX028_21990, partial [Escherichia coli]|nr:hypothetical protein [Escherichia coli]